MTTPPNVRFEPMHTQLIFDEPIQVIYDGIQSDTVYVVEKDGIIQNVSVLKDATQKRSFLDITDRVGVTNDEEGLLSAVFHPKYAENGELYVWYSAQNPKRGVLSRFKKSPEQSSIDTSSEEVLLEVREPWGNHNGGTVLFGPDGYLYLGIGDGGAANDPHGNGQNKNTLLGSVIRIDVNPTPEPLATPDSFETENKTKGNNKPYAIPTDNPLVGQAGIREELWAWGLRNPWRMSFDRKTGELWTGDVGQNAWEEIDIVESGKNYGWNSREGAHDFKNNRDKDVNMTDPVHEYGRRMGGSITGGYVYRGTKIPALVGAYVFSDYLSKRVWALVSQEGEDASFEAKRIAKKTPIAISSFGESPSGEILACGFPNAYSSKGKVYWLVSSEPTTSTIR